MSQGYIGMNNRLKLVGVLLVIIFLFSLIFMPKEQKNDEEASLRIGAGNDITGVLLNEIKHIAEKDQEGNFIVESYIFADCCSNAAEWSLQADDIDLGFYCAQAAMHMVKGNNDFEIYGPVIYNGEVLATIKGNENIDIIGIPRKRNFLKNIISETYPELHNIVEINRTYGIYALESGEVDAMTLDVTDVINSKESLAYKPVSDKEYISYCLVVRKNIETNEKFLKFLAYYEQAVDILNDKDYLVNNLGMTSDFWEMTGIQFLHLE